MRKLSQRYVVRAKLRLETPLHVGGALSDVRSDMPLAEDGQGNCYIPGTSFAGALRAWAAPEFRPGGEAEDQDAELWGADFYPWGPPPRPRGHVSDASDRASHIVVEDAPIPKEAVQEIRDHVGIARDIGAAAAGIKYDRAVLPRGTLLPLNMTLEVPRGCEAEAERKLTALLLALNQRLIRFGASRSRGLGRVRLYGDPDIRLHDLLSPQGIKAMLRARIEPNDDKPAAGAEALACWRKEKLGRARQAIDIKIRWRALGPVMVKSGEEGLVVDMLPLVSGDGTSVSLVLPGSAIKGVLRAHAERILRTVCGVPALPSDGTAGRFLDQLRQGELALARWLFGAPGERKDDTPEGELDQSRQEPGRDKEPGLGLGLAALWVDDVYLAKPFERDAWEKIAGAPDLERKDGSPGIVQLAEALTEQSGIALDPAMHVAVDRWTGGAAEHQLYSVLEPHPADAEAEAWEPIRLTLWLDRLRDGDKYAALGLLLLVLRDVANGLVPIGFGGNRGLGAIAIDKVTYRGLGALPGGVAPDESYRDDGGLKQLPEALVRRIRQDWQAHIEAIGKETAHVG